MSSPYATLDDRPLEKWKVTELREELKRRNLATKGLKEELLKRLDEAIRSEQANTTENSDNDAAQSELPLEQAEVESGDPENAKDLTDVGIDTGEKLDGKVEDETNDDGRSLEESKVTEPALVSCTKSAELEEQQVIDEEIETMPTLSGSHLHVGEKNVDSDSTEVLKMDELHPLQEDTKTEPIDPKVESSQTNVSITTEDSNSAAVLKVDELQPLQEDAKPEPTDPKVQASQTNESIVTAEVPSKLNLQVNENQNESMQSTIQMDVKDSKHLQAESSIQPLKHQVSEVDCPNLGLQTTSDSLSTESVSINEKNELKVNAITDNVQLELDVKHEMVLLSPGSSVADGSTLQPVDVEEPCSKNDTNELLRNKDIEEPLSKKNDVEETPLKKDLNDGTNAENADTFKNIDGLVLCPEEKLSLDHSSGDDSMEEDRLESNKLEYQADSNKISDNVKKLGMHMDKEDNHVDVVELKDVNVDNTSASALTSVKRKFRDEGTVGHNDTVKKARRLNADSLEGSELQSGSTSASITPKGLSEPILKHSSGADHALNEAPKERIVPPSLKPPSNSLRIDRFLRPFTLKAVQELLGKTGTVTSFWMDHIKTHCYVSYSSVEEALETRNAVYNLQWPPNGGRLLVAEFVDPQEVKARVEAPPAPPSNPLSGTVPNFSANAQPNMPPLPSPRQQVSRLQLPLPPSLPPPPPLSNPALVQEHLHSPREPSVAARDRFNLPPPPPPAAAPNTTEMPIVTLDDLFRKTKATPRIYYLPLSDEQVAAKVKSSGNQ